MTNYSYLDLEPWVKDTLIESDTDIGYRNQLRWTVKTMKTRSKLTDLKHRVNLALTVHKPKEGSIRTSLVPPSIGHSDKNTLTIIEHLLNLIQVDEFKSGVKTTMLSNEGVKWCNEVVEIVNEIQKSNVEP